MSTQRKPTLATEGISAEAVAYYLQHHPDFFEANSQLLASLSLPHTAGSTTISLIERQVAVLREQNGKLERRLNDLIDTARRNDRLSDGVHQLALNLLRADGPSEVIDAIESALREDFSAKSAVLVLRLKTPDLEASARKGRFLRLVDPGDPGLQAFQTLFDSGRARCGHIRDTQREFLFGADADGIGSAAVVPLGPKGKIGVLAIGSVNVEHFHPGMSTDFLERVGSLAGTALQASLDAR
jgi:uncharacterized protein YigA (DUF484 family)